MKKKIKAISEFACVVMKMKFEHLKYFIEVVQCESINKAAKKLFVSQPTVTSTIKALENDLGFQLIERSHKGVSLTEKGKIVFEDAKKIIEMEKKWRMLDEREPEIGGDVHIAVVPSATSVVLKCVAAMKKKYPSVNIIIHDGRKYNFLSILEQRVATIGILGYVKEEKGDVYRFLEQSGYRIDELFVDDFCVFIGKNHRLTKKQQITVDDFKSLSVAIYAGQDPVASYFMDYFDEHECYYVNDLNAMMDIALQGEVAAVCTKLYAYNSPLVQSGLLQVIDLKEFDVSFNYCLLYPSEKTLTPTEKVVVQELKRNFRNY